MACNKCVAGCKVYDGNETYHHKDCPFYPESFSERFDQLQTELDNAKTETSKNGYHQTWHFCENGAVRPYPQVLCSARHTQSHVRDFNALAELNSYLWIPVSERLPDKSEQALAFNQFTLDVAVGKYEGDNRWVNPVTGIWLFQTTHWKPIILLEGE